jgi:hypothetical protein
LVYSPEVFTSDFNLFRSLAALGSDRSIFICCGPRSSIHLPPQIGGYQILSKWLKDRKERRLTLDEIKSYCRVVTALQRTLSLREEIDALYPEVEIAVLTLLNGT